MGSKTTELGSPLRALASAIQRRCKVLGLTPQQLAQLSGVSLAFLDDLEQGNASLRLDKLLDVLDVLGLELRLVQGRAGLSVDAHLRNDGERGETR